jgi:hypothetical protein
MTMAFPVLTIAGGLVVAAAVVAWLQTGSVGYLHVSLGLVATIGFFGAVGPTASRWRRPALVVGIGAAIAGVALGGYLLAFAQPVNDLLPTWLDTAFCAFWLGSLWMLAVLRFR